MSVRAPRRMDQAAHPAVDSLAAARRGAGRGRESASPLTQSTHVSNAVSGGDSTKTSLVGIYLGQLLLATLAILTITEEYATGMIRLTFTAMPDRIRVLASKALSLLGPTIAASAVMVAGCLVAGRLLLPAAGLGPAHGYALISLAHNATLRAAAGTAIYLPLIALLSLGIATVLRDTAVSIGAVFSLLFLPQILARIVGGAAGRHIEQIAPMTAGLSIEATTRLHRWRSGHGPGSRSPLPGQSPR